MWEKRFASLPYFVVLPLYQSGTPMFHCVTSDYSVKRRFWFSLQVTKNISANVDTSFLLAQQTFAVPNVRTPCPFTEANNAKMTLMACVGTDCHHILPIIQTKIYMYTVSGPSQDTIVLKIHTLHATHFSDKKLQ